MIPLTGFILAVLFDYFLYITDLVPNSFVVNSLKFKLKNDLDILRFYNLLNEETLPARAVNTGKLRN